MAGLEQFALDPLVSPAVILAGEPLDQRGDLGADLRPACPVRVSPFPGDQAAVPPQHGAGSDQPVHPQVSGQQPDERGQDRAVGPVQPGRGMGAAQHGNFVLRYKELDVLRRR